MREIRTPQDRGHDFFDISEAYDGERSRKSLNGTNLTLHRWHSPVLTAGDELDLIRAAQAGDGRAKDKLMRAFHRLVLKLAKQYSGPARDDLVAAGLLGLSQAIKRYDLRRNSRLGAYACHWIRKRIREAVKEWRKGGQAGETRADRYVYDKPNATAEEIAKATGCALADAEAAIQRAETYRNGHDRYDTTENGRYDEDDNFLGQRRATAHEIYSLYDFYSEQQLSPQPRFHGAVSRVVDALAVDADKRAERRLKQIGRRAYALELVERNRKRVAARADEQQHLYPWKRWKSRPVVATHPRRKRKQHVESRRSPIRSWRWTDDNAAVAPA